MSNQLNANRAWINGVSRCACALGLLLCTLGVTAQEALEVNTENKASEQLKEEGTPRSERDTKRAQRIQSLSSESVSPTEESRSLSARELRDAEVNAREERQQEESNREVAASKEPNGDSASGEGVNGENAIEEGARREEEKSNASSGDGNTTKIESERSKENSNSSISDSSAADFDRPTPSRPSLPKPKLPPSPVTANPLTSALPPVSSMPSVQILGGASNSESENKNVNYEPGELLLVTASLDEAKWAEQSVIAYGLKVKSRTTLKHLNLVMSTLRLPAGEDTLKLAKRIRQDFPNLHTATNQRYRLLENNRSSVVKHTRKTYAHHLIRWPHSTALSCVDQSKIRIGMLDTTVNDAHPYLMGASVTTASFIKGESAGAEHGTAVASLLVGQPDTSSLGLLPNANLFAANVFRSRDNTVEATTDSLLSALNWLLENRVQIINLSLGGEENLVFSLALESVLKTNTPVVASAGNDGPQAVPVFPAAQVEVIAVTAVDAAKRVYLNANVGNYIEYSAPGVDVWAANESSGGQYHSGTSFAAPFVAAALALVDDARLRSSTLDLGEAGVDDVFGRGLIQVPLVCP